MQVIFFPVSGSPHVGMQPKVCQYHGHTMEFERKRVMERNRDGGEHIIAEGGSIKTTTPIFKGPSDNCLSAT